MDDYFYFLPKLFFALLLEYRKSVLLTLLQKRKSNAIHVHFIPDPKV